MFGIRTAKDVLIETLQGQIADLKRENAAFAQKCAEFNAELNRLRAPAKQKQEQFRPGARSMSERVRRLSQNSLRNAMANDPKRNLVAEMPPPGAFGPAAAPGEARSSEDAE